MVSRMYLRPGELFKDFKIEVVTEHLSESGRPTVRYELSDRLLRGSLADASPKEIERCGQRKHPITHTVVEYGMPVAKPDDKLILGNRVFLIQEVDSAGDLGIATIYYVEERDDVT